MFELVKYGRKQDDPSFYFRSSQPLMGATSSTRDAWAIANPALGDFLTADGLLSVAKTMRRAAFRRYRLGQWVGSSDSWLPFGAWEKRVDDRALEPGEGGGRLRWFSFRRLDRAGRLHDGRAYRPDQNMGKPEGSRLAHFLRGDVTAAVDWCFDTYNVLELAADPWGWRSRDRRVGQEAWCPQGRQRVQHGLPQPHGANC